MSTIGFLQLETAAPPFRSSAYGLLSVATVPENVGLRALSGGTFLSGAAGEADGGIVTTTGAGACDPLGFQATPKAPNIADDWRDALVVVLYGWWQCAPVGYDTDTAGARVRTAFLNGESRALEAILWEAWTGSCDATSTTLTEALAAAEEAIAADYGGEGIIHINRGTAALLNAEGASLTRVGSTLRTVSYTPVVVGDGYPAADRGTIVATGPISVVRGELMDLTPDHAAGINRAVNNLDAVVERAYLVSVDGPAACFTTA